MLRSTYHEDLLKRIERDLIDDYDEELELEIEDRDISDLHAKRGAVQARVRNPDYLRHPVPANMVVPEVF